MLAPASLCVRSDWLSDELPGSMPVFTNTWYLSENSGGVRILRVCDEAAHSQNAVLRYFSNRYLGGRVERIGSGFAITRSSLETRL